MTIGESTRGKSPIRRWGRNAIRLLAVPVFLWAAGAIWFDLPGPPVGRKIAAISFLLGTGFLWFSKSHKRRAAALGILGATTGWWFTQMPRDDRVWPPDAAKTAFAEVDGDTVTLHNVRNFDYRSATDYTPRWETRVVDLSKLTGIDLVMAYWGSPYMAHPIISFQFSDSPPVCFSIESRKEKGESLSAIASLYRQYELIYIVGDEKDVIRVRTNCCEGEDVYLYRLNGTPEKARERFRDYVAALNELHEEPRWYNALTTNCTTSIRTQHAAKTRALWDWRMLVNGKADEMLYERGMLLTGGLDFAALKASALINPAARVAHDAPDFSARIREGRPGLQTTAHDAANFSLR